MKHSGAARVRRVNRVGRHEKRFLQIIEYLEPVSLETLYKIFNCSLPSKAHIRRTVASLERKEKIRLQGDYIFPKKRDIREFKTNQDIIDYYEEIRKLGTFTEFGKNNKIKIEADFLFYFLLREQIDSNKSLDILKENDHQKYNKLVLGMSEQLNSKIMSLKRRLFNWSNKKYRLRIDTEKHKISMIHNCSEYSVIIDLEKLPGKRFSNNLLTAECILLFRSELREIMDHVLNVSNLDYRHFLIS